MVESITIGVKAAVGGAVTLCGGLFLVGQLLLSDMRDDVGRVRDHIDTLQAVDRETAANASAIEVNMTGDIAELTAELRLTNERLLTLTNSLGNLDGTVRGINSALLQSIDRQKDFERWVTVRLGPLGSEPIMFYPEQWEAGQAPIFEGLTSSKDPLGSWYEAVSAEEN